MKLLFDDNISFRILRSLPDIFAESKHIRSVGLKEYRDTTIWLFAKQNGFTVVTFDADFFNISLIRGAPPKIIWLRTGNMPTAKIVERLILNYPMISSFLNNTEQNCLEIF